MVSKRGGCGDSIWKQYREKGLLREMKWVGVIYEESGGIPE